MVDRALEIVVRSRYLALPIDRKAPVRRVKVSDGSLSREFDIKLAEGLGDFSTYLDLSKFASKTLKIEARLPGDSTCFERLTQVDAIPDASKIHHEPGRPGFHFTSARGWLNDPNGLVFFEGEYHLFYQHNPYGWDWGNMHWGHAVSPDLIHWEELPIAIFPKNYGDWAFSGSAVVDRSNTSGFGTATNPPLVAAYTSTGRGECIVFSLDRGRTWTEFDGNPVVKHAGRDPRLLWHEPTHRWVMAVYDETDGRRDVAIYSSPDLKAWTFESRIGGFYECPDLFELPVQGTPEQKFWVLLAADGAYLLGQFDGKTFHLSGPTAKQKLWHGNFYAAQTFSDEPKGRRVQIGWAQGIEFPGEPFNQQMNVPCELTLRSTPQGIRLFAEPVAELAKLRIGDPSVAKGSGAGEGVLSAHLQASEYFDLQLIALGTQAGDLTLTLPGATLSYDGLNRILTCNGEKVRLDQNQSGLKLRILVDRGSIEVFGNDGIVAISKGLTKRSSLDQDVRLKFESYGVRSGTQRSFSIELYPLKSSWRWCLRIAERDKFLVNMKLTT
jgi:fructan beta-fructosidase